MGVWFYSDIGLLGIIELHVPEIHFLNFHFSFLKRVLTKRKNIEFWDDAPLLAKSSYINCDFNLLHELDYILEFSSLYLRAGSCVNELQLKK